jgi:hypothetical protein
MQTDPLPESLKPFFQEYEFTDLDSDLAAATIIERTLQFGNREEIRWLFKRYPRSEIISWLSSNGPERLPEPHLSFWKLLLKI